MYRLVQRTAAERASVAPAHYNLYGQKLTRGASSYTTVGPASGGVFLQRPDNILQGVQRDVRFKHVGLSLRGHVETN